MKLKLIAAAVAAIVSVPAFAASIDRRAVYEQQRINQGVRSGELTGREAARLERREVHVDREIARDRMAGRLGPAERARIQRQENSLSRAIYCEKHDGQFR